jgi:hypothetical protein
VSRSDSMTDAPIATKVSTFEVGAINARHTLKILSLCSRIRRKLDWLLYLSLCAALICVQRTWHDVEDEGAVAEESDDEDGPYSKVGLTSVGRLTGSYLEDMSL